MPDIRLLKLRNRPLRRELTWQGGLAVPDFAALGLDIEEDEPPVLLPVWACTETREMHSAEPIEGLDADVALEVFVEMASDPKKAGYLPGRLEVRPAELVQPLRDALGPLGIEVVASEGETDLDELLDAGIDVMRRQTIDDAPAMVKAPGVNPLRLRAFGEAARAFWNAQAWKEHDSFDLVEVESPTPPEGMRYVNVMGSAGEQFGFGFFRSADMWRRMVQSDGPVDDLVLKQGAWNATFDPMDMVPEADRDAWKKIGGEAGADDMVPTAAFMSHEEFRRPDAAELAFLEGLFRAIVESTEEEMDSGRWRKTVRTFDGEMEYVLSMPGVLREDFYDVLGEDRPPYLMSEAMLAQMKNVRRKARSLGASSGTFGFANPAVPDASWEEAQDLAIDAARSLGRRIRTLCRRAIAICPDCSDACCVLGEYAVDPDERVRWFEQATAAADRALPAEIAKLDADATTDTPQGQAWVRARMYLALGLAEADRPADAARVYMELLKWDPGDNAMARHGILPLLSEVDDQEGISEVLVRWPLRAPGVLHAHALFCFRRGLRDEADERLARAIEHTPQVTRFILGVEEPAERSELHVDPDRWHASEDAEALWLAFGATPAAEEWLRDTAREDRFGLFRAPRTHKSKKQKKRKKAERRARKAGRKRRK